MLPPYTRRQALRRSVLARLHPPPAECMPSAPRMRPPPAWPACIHATPPACRAAPSSPAWPSPALHSPPRHQLLFAYRRRRASRSDSSSVRMSPVVRCVVAGTARCAKQAQRRDGCAVHAAWACMGPCSPLPAAPRTLAHGPLHVAHDEAVLVVQELDADLGDLRGWQGRAGACRQAGEAGGACMQAWGQGRGSGAAHGPAHGPARMHRGAAARPRARARTQPACPPRTWPREPVRPMTFITMASFTGWSCAQVGQKGAVSEQVAASSAARWCVAQAASDNAPS